MIGVLAAVAILAASATGPSTYTGDYYSPAHEGTRKCIAARESEGKRDATGANGKYRGPYQMVDPLADGAAWMMIPELSKWHGETKARLLSKWLRATPMNKWPALYQDMAFWTVYSYKYPGSGAKHWAGGRWVCRVEMRSWSR